MEPIFRLCDDNGECVDVDLGVLGLELQGRVIQIHVDDSPYVCEQFTAATDNLLDGGGEPTEDE